MLSSGQLSSRRMSGKQKTCGEGELDHKISESPCMVKIWEPVGAQGQAVSSALCPAALLQEAEEAQGCHTRHTEQKTAGHVESDRLGHPAFLPSAW